MVLTVPDRVGGPPAAGPGSFDSAVRNLLAWQAFAVALKVAAVYLARSGIRGPAELLTYPALGVAFGSALWALTRPELSRATRNTAVVCLGITPTLMWRSTNPLLFTGFDEQLHMRTLSDIMSSQRLFEANPLLGISPRYPGLEATTALLCQIGLPAMAAGLVVILVSRLILVTVLCDAVEQLTGSARAGGLAVAVYAASPQFVFFNSQFSYQTLALPLALAAVSLIARARRSADPMPLVAGATICLAGMVMTHHVTSFLTTLLLLAWVTAERGPTRVPVAYGALAAVSTTLAWALMQWTILEDYLGPIADDLRAQLASGARRQVFSDSAGTASSVFDRGLLVHFAVTLSAVIFVVTVVTVRRWWRGGHHWRLEEPHRLHWGPHQLVLLLAAITPVLLAARVLPKGGEFFDRGSSFLFLPISLVVAGLAVAHWWPAADQGAGNRKHPRVTVPGRAVAVVLAAGVFLGGYVLGSGPNWARLPGPYMAAADTRSMDAETLAAVEWADRSLPDGSRIGADRVSSVLLASEARVWPVMKGPGGLDVASLYVAMNWGERQTQIAAALKLRYLYVDRRLADSRPPYGSYFFRGETGMGQQLSDAQLTKFDRMPGITEVYRHGPVSIYDLKGISVPELRSGWFRAAPQVRMTEQIGTGLLAGALLAGALSTMARRRVGAALTRFRRAAGLPLTVSCAVAGACLTAIALLIAGVWFTPLAATIALAVAAVSRHRRVRPTLRRVASRMPWRRLVLWGLIAGPLCAAVIGVAVDSAAHQTIERVQDILSTVERIASTESGR